MNASFSSFKDDSDFQHMSCILEKNKENQFVGDLYLGDYVAATELKTLRQKNVKTVITCGIDLDVKYGHNVVHYVYELLDSDKQEIYQYFQKAHAAIMAGLREGSVLIHCTAGISRSATIGIAFMMQHKYWNFQQALNYIKSKRYMVCPNRGFVSQLKTFSKLLEKKTNNDNLIDRINKTNSQIALSLQQEIQNKNPEFAKGLGLPPAPIGNSKNQQQNKFQTMGIQSKRKNSRAHSAKGFRLIDLVDLETSFNRNLNLSANKMPNYSTHYTQQSETDMNNNNLDITKVDLEKLTQAPSPPQQKMINEKLRRLSKRSNSQQKLHQMTEKLLKEEIDINYNKFEYKPRFKRISSATNRDKPNQIEFPSQKQQQQQQKKPPLRKLDSLNNKPNSGTRSQRNLLIRNKSGGGKNKQQKQQKVQFEDMIDENDSFDHTQLIAEFQDLEEQYLGEHKELDQNITLSRRKSHGLPPKPMNNKRGFYF